MFQLIHVWIDIGSGAQIRCLTVSRHKGVRQ